MTEGERSRGRRARSLLEGGTHSSGQRRGARLSSETSDRASTGVESEVLKKEIVALIRDRIGPIATPKILNLVPQLPKTRSGRVMRRVLRALCEEKALGDLSTIEDGASVDEIKKALEEMGQMGNQPQRSSSPLGREEVTS
jgi:hypothetical protein